MKRPPNHDRALLATLARRPCLTVLPDADGGLYVQVRDPLDGLSYDDQRQYTDTMPVRFAVTITYDHRVVWRNDEPSAVDFSLGRLKRLLTACSTVRFLDWLLGPEKGNEQHSPLLSRRLGERLRQQGLVVHTTASTVERLRVMDPDRRWSVAISVNYLVTWSDGHMVAPALCELNGVVTSVRTNAFLNRVFNTSNVGDAPW